MSAVAAPPRALRVLVIEDNADAAEVLRIMVSSWGHQVTVAWNGEDALRRAEELKPDVLLLDISLPRVHGHEIARQVRSRPWSSGVTMIAISAWALDQDRRQSRQAGIDHHFSKPVDAKKLYRLLQRVQPIAENRAVT